MDVSTEIIFSAAILFVIGGIFIAIHKLSLDTLTPRLWAGACIGFGIGYLLLLTPGVFSDFWPVLVANFLLVAANVIFFIGVAEFLKRPKLVPLWAVVLVIYGVGFGYFWVSDTPLGVRYLLIGPVGALISSMTLWYLCSGMTAEDALGRNLASAFQILLLLFSVMVTLGGLFILIGDFPSTGQDSLLKTEALGFGIALHMIGLTGFSLALVTMVLQRALADTNRAMETVFSANQTKSDFLAAMSHDLRTPLNAILGFSDMMRSEMYGPLGARKYSEYANDIHGSGSQLLTMVDNILDLTKVEAGEYRLNEEEVDIGVTLGFCIRQVEPMTSPSRQDMLLEIPETAPKLWADERLLTQIFGNILSNAAKFTPEDGKITISASVEATRGVIVSISDNGHGVPREDIESVLQPFQQSDTFRSYKHRGTGLGLPLCQQFMSLHGGRIAIESTLGVGTTVTLSFPAERTL